jgi:hypothetical protein
MAQSENIAKQKQRIPIIQTGTSHLAGVLPHAHGVLEVEGDPSLPRARELLMEHAQLHPHTSLLVAAHAYAAPPQQR